MFNILDIVMDSEGRYGVITATFGSPDNIYCAVRMVGKHTHGNTTVYTNDTNSYYDIDQITKAEFCENDHEQALILCAASGVAFNSANSYSVASE